MVSIAREMAYVLPSHPANLCTDPLAICGDDSPTTTWDVISTAISTAAFESPSPGQLPDLIESLVYSLHGNGSVDTQGLRLFLRSNPPAPTFYSTLYASAASLPDLFPDHSIPYLTDQNPRTTLSTEQLNALLAHQVLGTLDPPVGGWGSPTFLCWYAGNNPHPLAVESYLTTLFHHFSNLQSSLLSPPFQFYLSGVQEELVWESCELPMRLELIPIDEESEPSQPDAKTSDQQPSAVVVSSNHQPGFGPSATQEERIFGASVLLCPLLLFCPVLPPHTALISSPTPIHAAWSGHNRTARLTAVYPPTCRPSRYHVFIDALELDIHDQHECGLPDLAGDNIERELRKFYAGCVGLCTLCSPLPTPVLEAGAWGCGAFGGNAVVKAILMAMAASRAGVDLHLRLRRDRGDDLELIAKVMEAGLTVGGAMAAMKVNHDKLSQCKDGNSFAQLLLSASRSR